MKKLLSLLLVVASLGGFAQNPTLSLQTFSTGYSNPVDIENCGDNRLFIVEKGGKIWIADANGNKSAQPFLDLTSKVTSTGSEQGLLGLAFHPQYKTNGYFYVNYIDKQQNTQIARYKVSATDSNKATASSAFKILHIKQPFSNHNGGCLKFGPDGYLYIGMGDGGSEGDPQKNGQKHNTFLSKMLRIDVNNGSPYSVPATNPFVGVLGYKPEIWALGLRNPWRFSFDRTTGDLWIGDVGQDSWEEVDFQPAVDTGGENYGWRCYEGNHTYNTSGCAAIGAFTFPVAENSHSSGDCAVTGGFVYRGSLYPNMMGKYFYSDYCSANFRMIYNDGTWHNVSLAQFSTNPVSFGEDKNGEIYTAGIYDGKIYHLVDLSQPRNENFFIGDGLTEQSLLVYPNPAHGNFTLQFENENSTDATVKIEVTNSLGVKVYEEERFPVKGINIISLNAADFAKGIYIVTVSNSSSKRIAKLIIE